MGESVEAVERRGGAVGVGKRGKQAGGYVVNCGVRQYLNRANARLDEADARIEMARYKNAAGKIKAARVEIENAERKIGEFERHGELIALVYAMRHRDKMTTVQIMLALRGMPPAYWMTEDQVEYLLTKERKCLEWHKNAC